MKTPQLKLHARGVYFTRWRRDGRTISTYFTKDRQESERLFAEWLANVWTAEALSVSATRRPPENITIVQLSKAWLTNVALERGQRRMSQYRSAIANFVHLYGALPASKLTLEDLAAFRHDLAREYRPVTVVAYMKAVKRLLKFGIARRLMPPLDLNLIRLERPPRPAPIRVTPDFVRQYLAAAAKIDPRLPPHLGLIYLTCARPSEVSRLIAGQGRTVFTSRRGQVFETAGKTQAATGVLRYLPLTTEAVQLLNHARAAPFQTHDWFLKLALRVKLCGHSGAKRLRSWGASELRHLGIPREDIRRVLGHTGWTPLDHYVNESWENLLATAARLTLQPRASRRRSGVK